MSAPLYCGNIRPLIINIRNNTKSTLGLRYGTSLRHPNTTKRMTIMMTLTRTRPTTIYIGNNTKRRRRVRLLQLRGHKTLQRQHASTMLPHHPTIHTQRNYSGNGTLTTRQMNCHLTLPSDFNDRNDGINFTPGNYMRRGNVNNTMNIRFRRPTTRHHINNNTLQYVRHLTNNATYNALHLFFLNGNRAGRLTSPIKRSA